MKNVFTPLFISLFAATLWSCGSPSLPIGEEDAGLGFRPIQLLEGETKFYLHDYVLSDVESVDWPEGLTAQHQADSGIYRISGKMKQPLGVVTLHAAGGEYSVLLKQSMTPRLASFRPRLGFYTRWSKSSRYLPVKSSSSACMPHHLRLLRPKSACSRRSYLSDAGVR